MTTFARESSNRSNIVAIGGLTDGRDAAHLIIQSDGQMLFSGYKVMVGIPSSANATTSTPFFYNGDGFSSLGFQRNMLSNVGVTTPKIHCGFSVTGGTNYQGGILDNTGNLYVTGYNSIGNWGDTTTTDITTFKYINQYFPNRQLASDFLMSGSGATHGGATIALLDGTLISCGKNVNGSAPYEYNPSSTPTPFYRYVPGYSPSDIN
jgi:hypothetical protein